jgi:pimeloyl-ACP methyl ester carboxylesterase
MAQVTSAQQPAASGYKTIRPFDINIPEEELTDLRNRIVATRWPEKETVDDLSQGPKLSTMQEMARYWAEEYDWRKCEAKLKALPNFITEIDGLDIHFVHVRSEHEDALPLLVTHGWPGSIVEQLKIVGPLTDPTAHGGDESDAFHLVIPSIHGFGFSGKPTTTGWGPDRIADAWIELMKRLGYTSFVAQGGDWGAIITDLIGAKAPPELLGIHTNMAGAVRPDISAAVQKGAPPPAGLTDEENNIYERLKFFFATDAGYAIEMGTHPQALYGIADSPIGLAAWMLDHDYTSMTHISDVFDGDPKGFGLTRDDFLDNVTLFWLTNTGVSSGRLYAEFKGGFFDAKGVKVPVGVSVFPEDIYTVTKSWAEAAYPNLIHYNKLDKGGHFAAWEVPELFVPEVREAFKSLR